MATDSTQNQLDMLTFMIPGLPDLRLAVALIEVLESADLPAPTPIPFAPPALLGITKWRGGVISVFDLACLITGQPSGVAAGRCLVAQTVVNQQIDRVAWPILAGARIDRVPAQISPVETPGMLLSPFVRASFKVESGLLIWFNLDHLGI